MKFSDLANPAAADKLIKDFKKRFSAKICLSPTGNCEGDIISAHTLSVGAMLRPLSRAGEVYAIKANLYDPTGPATIGLQGVQKTSVFTGFCARHDKDLFSPIEDQPFICSYEQLFIHAFRAIAKESYLKRKQAESLPTLDELKAIHGVSAEIEMQMADEILISTAASLRGAEEMERTKVQMDDLLVARSWSRLITTVIPFQKPPNVVCSFVFSPQFDFDGNILQDFEDWETDLSQLFVTIFPTTSGGFALLSHLDTANTAPRKFIESLVTRSDITSSLLWLILLQSENFAISPDWYEGISEQERALISEAVFSNADPFNTSHFKFSDCKLTVTSWDPTSHFRL